ncbi:hypothetical protein MRF4_23100 [Methylobacterium radiotolerans]
MRTLLVAAIFFGSTVGAMAVESYTDYRDYFDANSIVTDRAARGVSRKMYDIDTRRYDDGRADRAVTNLKPGHWNQAGGYVPPDYSTHPHGASRDGFWSPIDTSSASWGTPKAFTGTLGTRR